MQINNQVQLLTHVRTAVHADIDTYLSENENKDAHDWQQSFCECGLDWVWDSIPPISTSADVDDDINDFVIEVGELYFKTLSTRA